MSELGDRIRELRKQSKMTQAELAEKVGVSLMTIRRYESGERVPSIALVEDLARVLGSWPIPVLETKEDVDRFIESHIDAYSYLRLLEPPKNFEDIFDQEEVPIIKYKLVNEEAYLLHYFLELNADGRREVLRRIREMKKLDEYTNWQASNT